MSYTKGEWDIKIDNSEGIQRHEILHGNIHVWANHTHRKPINKEQGIANVKLIAASPKMYEYIEKKSKEGCKHAIEIINQITK